MKNSLWQISVTTTAEAEDSVRGALEDFFQSPPSVYSNARTKKSVVTVYREEKPDPALLTGLKLPITVKPLARENWAESWKRHFKPIPIGRSLLIKPGWSKRQPVKGQAVVILDPGLSFGTGHHATTMFCLRRIVACRGSGPQSFLDIGCGSGILSIAAAKMGYAPIESFDFDPEAVRASRQNVRQNKAQRLVRPVQKDLTTLPLHGKKQYDLICANLIYDLLIAEAPRIIHRLKPGGRLILAGILRRQFSRVQKRFENLGLKLISKSSEKEWKSGQFEFAVGLAGKNSARGKVKH